MIGDVASAAFGRVVFAGAFDLDTETFHLAGHSAFKGNFALPPKGETAPSWPHPSAHFTASGAQR